MSNSTGAGLFPRWGAILAAMVIAAPAFGQIMIANDDPHSLQLGQPLVVDAPGVLDNDLLDGESAAEMGAVAELVLDAAHGDLVLGADGAFSYSPGPTFEGMDSFAYAAVFGAVSDQATVFLSACEGGPDVFMCWKEGAFNALAEDLGYYAQVESFEDDAVWAPSRSPNTAPSVTNLGVRWTTNHPDAPAFNEIRTGPGPARTGLWGAFDAEHGYAEGTPSLCDVDNPPEPCLFHDGLTGEAVTGAPPLVGIAGFFHGIWGANVAIIIDDVDVYPGGRVYNHQFLGVIDTRPAGFRKFSFEEQDGKIGQAFYVWADDFTLLTSAPPVSAVDDQPSRFFFAGAGPNPAAGATTWRFNLAAESAVQLRVYDARGRLVRELRNGVLSAGEHGVGWNNRDVHGRPVAAGTYLGRLTVTSGAQSEDQVRKLIVLH